MSITPSHFYHQTTRKMVVLFGTLFNDIKIKKPDGKYVKVPLTYSSKQRWYSILQDKEEHDVDGNGVKRPEAITYPRLAYSLTDISYDASRKLSSRNMLISENKDDNVRNRVLAPVPYNLSFELYLISRTMEDGLQIIEQIIPFFTPRFSVTINELDELNLSRDIEIVLNNVSYTDDYEGGYTDGGITTYTWTLSFKMETNFYGPTKKQPIIKKIDLGAYIGTPEDNDILSMTEVSISPDNAHINDEFEINTKNIKILYE